MTLPDGRQLRREIHAGSSYLATDDPRVHFGLGDHEEVEVTVQWPDGQSRSLTSVEVDRIVSVERA